MEAIYSFTGNYGWAVALFTLLVRLVVLPLDYKSRQSMRAVSRIQPKIQDLQKKYGDDREKLNKKMSALYKKEHVNPLMGCLPTIVQLVIMIFMFTAMRNIANAETGKMLVNLFNDLIEKGADGVEKLVPQGFFWIKNIFQPDTVGATILPSYDAAISMIKTAKITFEAPENLRAIYDAYLAAHYGVSQFMTIKVVLFNVTIPTSLNALMTYGNGLFVLPAFACLSQIVMTKLTAAQSGQPVSNDPNQPGNMMNSGMMKWFFPLFTLWICSSQSAAFSVYWAVANIVAIIQTFVINKILQKQDEKMAAKAESDLDSL